MVAIGFNQTVIRPDLGQEKFQKGRVGEELFRKRAVVMDFFRKRGIIPVRDAVFNRHIRRDEGREKQSLYSNAVGFFEPDSCLIGNACAHAVTEKPDLIACLDQGTDLPGRKFRGIFHVVAIRHAGMKSAVIGYLVKYRGIPEPFLPDAVYIRAGAGRGKTKQITHVILHSDTKARTWNIRA